MLRLLRLINWRSHADSTLEFRKGTNLLMGLMGAGKSSVLDGICYALFGTFPAVEHRKMKLEDLIRLNENECKVVLEIAFANDIYKIERKCSKTKKGVVSDAEVYKNNALMDKGPSAVTNYIEHLLKVDYDLFTRAIYSEQNNIDYFLTIDPRRRKEEVDILLGLNKFEDARSNAVSLANRLKSNRKILETKFSRERLNEYMKSKSEKEARSTILEKDISELKKVLILEKETVEKSEQSLILLRNKKQEFDILNKQKIELEGNVVLLRKQLDGKEVDDLPIRSKSEGQSCVNSGAELTHEKKLEELKNKKKDCDEKITAITTQLQTLENNYRNKTKEVTILETKMKTAEKNLLEISAAEKQLALLLDSNSVEIIYAAQKKCEATIVNQRSESLTLQNRIKELNEFDGKKSTGEVCPFCGGALSEEKIAHATKERIMKVEECKKRIAELSTLLSTEIINSDNLVKKLKNVEMITAKLIAVRSQTEDKEVVKPKLEVSIIELQKIIEVKNEKSKELATLNTSVQQLAVSLSEYVALISKKKQLEITEKSLLDVITKLTTIVYDEKSYEETRKKNELLKVTVEKMNGRLTTMETEFKSIGELLIALQKEILHLTSMEIEMKRLAELEEEFIIYKNILAETQTTLRTNLIEAINGAMNEIWHIFYPYKDFKALRLNVTDKDYEFEVFDGEWKAIESVCSGGERACAALTMRVALAMVLTPNLSWLILDEPTHNLDKEAVELLSQTLQFKVPEVVEQTFVITHEEGLMGSEFASSYRLKRDKENFGATVVEKV
ncbi:MAG: SMC family ATPase [Candidatus Micrarchaeota archaeon]|nr:SMC family ATPase [Candidatus Micrarchaeota archaeon]